MKYETSERIMNDLRQIAKEFDIVIYAGTQMPRPRSSMAPLPEVVDNDFIIIDGTYLLAPLPKKV